MQCAKGMRLRCVDNRGVEWALNKGQTCNVVSCTPGFVWVDESPCVFGFAQSRFKPIVRVKAPCIPSLDLLLRRAVAAAAGMTPEQREEMYRKQRESWVRGEMALSALGDA